MPINITPEFVQQLLDQIASLVAQNAELVEQNAEFATQLSDLTAKIAELQQTIKELEEKKNKNSKNSSKPPSSDGYAKKPTSLRGKSGKKQGGQEGHEGTNLSQRVPDRIVGCMPSKCNKCPHHDECMKNAKVTESRQVIDAVVTTEVVQYNKCRVTNCPLHGWTRDGRFPKGVNGPVQYGDNLQSLVVALNTVGAVSIARTHEILANVFGVPLSTATIKSMISRCAGRLVEVIPEIGNRLVSSDVDNADETGIRVDKKLHWAHVLCNDKYTLITVHPKRGWQAMEDIGYLLQFNGILIHDCWAPYWKHPGDVTHAICCAHLLRELTGVEENHPEYTWPTKFKEMLLEMKKVRDEKYEAGDMALSYYYQRKFSRMYDEIINTAYTETPAPEQTPGKKKGRKKRGKVLALVDRLKEYKASVCLFIKNFAVQFDNNQAERDLRMTKAKTKISGCFRTEEGAQEYLDIMSYVRTARKLGYNAYMAIQNAISGDPMFIFA